LIVRLVAVIGAVCDRYPAVATDTLLPVIAPSERLPELSWIEITPEPLEPAKLSIWLACELRTMLKPAAEALSAVA